MSSPLLGWTTSLPPDHRSALEWFDAHAGQEVSWPRPIEGRIFLATRAKGIYKPAGSEYALSVRQALHGPYPDEPVVTNTDGTWSFKYFQESLDLEEGVGLFTNVGLLKCMQDVVPIGVMLQTHGRPSVRYRVLGLALVAGFGDGYFTLQGFGIARVSASRLASASVPGTDRPQERADLLAGTFQEPFDPRAVEDERRRVLARVAQRQGQAGFRRDLLDAYGGRCPITGYDAPDALEAAHIVPYRGPVTNHLSNGLLLRADLHNLFDLGLVAVDVESETARVLLSDAVRGTRYAKLAGGILSLPLNARLRPSIEALRQHRHWAGL